MADMRLWTSVANAFEAYRRRLIADPKATYEHIWRLIHLHESLVVTLGSAFSSRLLSLWMKDPDCLGEANRLRRKITGIAAPSDSNSDADLSNGDACLDGYIKPWIDLIKDFCSNPVPSSSGFCSAIKSYASESPEKPIAFLEAWRKIAEVPHVFTGNLKRIDRYDAINTLRNKLAHVPLPHRVLQELHWGLRQELLSLMATDYLPTSDSPVADFESKKWHSVLRGRLHFGNHFLNGSVFGQIKPEPPSPVNDSQLVWSDGDRTEDWSVSPFIRVDSELKVSLLFLLNDIRNDPSSDEFKGEYHRFAAELMPVEKVPIPRLLVKDWISATPVSIEVNDPISSPQPSGDDNNIPQGDSTPKLESLPPHELRDIADSAFRSRDYRRAVEAFDELEKSNDVNRYNDVARSKHGAALWRLAEARDIIRSNPMEMLDRAIDLLEKAASHRDPTYRARSFYEGSKAMWHKWKHNSDVELLRKAVGSANTAATLQYEPAYVSWHEKVVDDLEAATP